MTPVAPAPLPLLTAAEMRRWDRHAVEGVGVPEPVLMEAAGRAAAAVIDALYPTGTVAAAVGRGNNGGDAVVALRTLRAWGRRVVAIPLPGAELPAALLHGWELPVADDAHAALASAAVVVDGILGTGARGEPRPPQAELIRALHAAGAPVVALDGPSGVDLGDGSTPGEAVRAAVTVTFGAPKRGLLLHPGRQHAGRIVVVEVGFPPLAHAPGAEVVTAEWVEARLPRLAPDAHKGSAGAVAVLAGRVGMGGAAILAAHGALRAGTGMVRVLSVAENRVPVQTAVPEALFVDRADAEAVASAIRASSAVLAGPGMGTDDAARELLGGAVVASGAPAVLDADALTLLAREPELLREGRPDRVVLTPHPGEMGRLLGRDTAAVVRDPFAAAAEAAERFGCAVLLKGAPSLVAAPGQPTLANTTGHSGVATGGMGDTLGGVAAALLGAGASPRDAAALAVFLAGRAAEIAGLGRSLLPRDVADHLAAALAAPARPGRLGAPGVLLDLPPAR